ncbi:MAG: DUF1576 domain-containing protein [Clostridia bacterium]|nr:DUF1576 domain-containing protein [Clostridia bacterium]
MVLRKKIVEKEIHKKQLLWILSAFPIAFLFFAFLNRDALLDGLWTIHLSPTILITDFLALGGIGAAFLNAALIGFMNLFLLNRFKMKINGLLIAAFLTMLGFAFLGKNLINIFPLYIGGWLYAKSQKIHMRDVIAVIMFSTGLSPIISQIMFADLFPTVLGFTLGFSVGVLIGFTITPIAAHMVKFHDGHNLYNIGFTAGIIGTLFASILRAIDKEIEPVSIIYTDSDLSIKILLMVLFLGLIVLGLYINPKSYKQYGYIFKYKGRMVTDFPFLVGHGITFVNMGSMGIFTVLLVTILGGVINGPILASIFTVVGFSALGKHFKNCIPIMLGVMATAFVLGMDLSQTTVIMAILFSTTVAPIAGSYGPVAGFLAGVLHLVIVMNIGMVHGGINLYNNGFSGGLVAGILIPVLDAFKKGD